MAPNSDIDPTYLAYLEAKHRVAYQIKDDPLLKHYRPQLRACGEQLTSLYQKAAPKLRYFCQKRFCPVCQYRKEFRWSNRVLNWLPDVKSLYPNAKWMYLTLTARNPPVGEVKAMLTGHMQPAFNRLKERKIWKYVIGYIRFTEVVPDKEHPDYANPHYHILLLVRPSMFEGVNSLSQNDWETLWADCLGQMDTPSVKCQRVHVTPHRPLKDHIQSIVRYSAKPLHSDYKPTGAWVRELIHQLRGMQLVTAGGVFWHIVRDIIQEDKQQATQELQPSPSLFESTYTDEDGGLCLDTTCPPE